MKRFGNYWPTEEQTLLLRAGLLGTDEAIDAWQRVQPRLDLERLDHASRRLLPLVYTNLLPCRGAGPHLTELGGFYRATWSWNQRLFQRAGELVDALDGAGIPSIVLKGMALITGYYRNMGARPMGDIDILVPTALAVCAAEALRRAGWAPRYALTPAFLAIKHAGPFEGGPGEECDLHWRSLEEGGAVEADDALWASSTTAAFQGRSFRLLSPTDQLLHVCIHGARWAWMPGVRWVADAMLIVRAGEIDWRRLVAQAVARRFILRMRETLWYLSTVMGAAIPTITLARLSDLPVSALERFEYRVKSRDHRVMGELPIYWCNYLRARPGGVIRPLQFARYLQRAWGLESVCHVPGRALALAARRLHRPVGEAGATVSSLLRAL